MFLYTYLQEGNPFDATAGYRNLTYEEVLQELVKHKEQLKKKDTHIRELEDYIDNLLVRVMEETPSILRVPYEPSRKAGKFSKSWDSGTWGYFLLNALMEGDHILIFWLLFIPFLLRNSRKMGRRDNGVGFFLFVFLIQTLAGLPKVVFC